MSFFLREGRDYTLIGAGMFIVGLLMHDSSYMSTDEAGGLAFAGEIFGLTGIANLLLAGGIQAAKPFRK